MVLTALRGAVGFLTRLPVGRDGAAWDAFRATPATFPAVGYLVGSAVAVPLLLPLPDVTVTVATLAWLYAVTGINHLDGVADLGDAAVVHGDTERRVEVLTDTTLGVGGTVGLGVVLLATALAYLGLAGAPFVIVLGVAVGAEVGAKTAMAGVAALGSARHDGLGSAFTDSSGPSSLLSVGPVALPVAALSLPSPVAAASLVGAVTGGGLTAWWASRLVGGVNGDAFGAANAVGRLVGLHVGVIAWTLS